MKKIICDINQCENVGKPIETMFLNIEIVPTGDSDYSAYEEKTVRIKELDLCEKHYKEFKKRMAEVLVKSDKGLYFPR